MSITKAVPMLTNSSGNFVKHTNLRALAKAVYKANPAHARLGAMDLSNQEVQGFLRVENLQKTEAYKKTRKPSS